MSTGVLLALSGTVEADLLGRIERRSDLTVVRRCADLTELVAAAAAGLGAVAVLDADDPVDRRIVARLRSAGTSAVVLCDERERTTYADLGAMPVVRGADPLPAIEALAAGVPARVPDPATGADAAAPGTVPDAMVDDLPGPGEPEPESETSAEGSEPIPHGEREPARMVVVTGAPGSPGRTTLAVALADELAAARHEVVLVDADLWGGAIAQTLGLVADTAGLSAAIRSADRGSLDQAALERLLVPVGDRLRVLTGLARAARWREIGPESLEVVLAELRSRVDWVVVEAPVLVPDDEAGFDFGPGRNAVAHALYAGADDLLVVGAAEPIGLERLVQALLDLDDVPGLPDRRTVVNRLRLSAAGPHPELSVAEALHRFAGVAEPVLVPDDRALADRALLTASTWRSAGPMSPARLAVRDLARRLTDEAGRPAPLMGRRRERRENRGRLWRRRRAD
ncbi:hypothetical protein IM660_13620 [Ruania alkalisoli]|uniref:CobQ/CobB/MinD/ParA nucleotide binding domain-containing protein n=1 Tax=Ruania alkalisoli TaxID=2779775 RepID=A0A7M1SQI6_9MICO|nr:hypothetical protein [Ruania alkalisoli]QOR69701.1 hypothetical protein IM660_13620 [Ruania alkalisoli]